MNRYTPDFDIDADVRRIYLERRTAIERAAEAGNVDEAIDLANTLLFRFVNRFRNCNLHWYFDEALHRILTGMNSRTFDTRPLLTPKTKFRIAFLFDGLSDTGGPAFHRYILDKYSGEVEFEQYVIVSNVSNSSTLQHLETYRYIREEMSIKEFLFVPPNPSSLEKANIVQDWLFERRVDFVMYQPSPLNIFATASRPTLLSASFSADCHVFTSGPGTGDFTFYVENDQVYKYRYDDPTYDERHVKTILLPLPPASYIENAEPISRSEMGLPDDAIVSASTNMWKSMFGDADILMQGIAALMRRFPNYHHLFIGTPRSSDSLEFFLNKNPDLKSRMRYVGIQPNIYRALKSVDFFVNSFPVSGATNIEIAAIGKPSIDLLSERDLSFHNTEFLRSNECAVCSMDEFVKLGARFIADSVYRDSLGAWLKDKVVRDLNKDLLVKERIYHTFLDEFRRRLGEVETMPALGVGRTVEMEKRIAFYSAQVRPEWEEDERWAFLLACREKFPELPFSWVAGLEEIERSGRDDRFEALCDAMPASLHVDTRVQVMLARAHRHFGRVAEAIEHAERAVDLAIYDQVPARLLTRLYLEAGNTTAAAALLSRTYGRSVSEADIEPMVAGMPADTLPIYYNF